MAKILNCKCGQELDVEGFAPGQPVQCPQCNLVLTVPGEAPAVTVAMAIDDEDDVPQRPTAGPGTPGYVNPVERRKRAAARETSAARSRLKKVILWPCLVLGLACLVVAGLGVKWAFFTEPTIQIVNEDGFDVLYARVNVAIYKKGTFDEGPRRGQTGYTRVVDGTAEAYEKVEIVKEDGKVRVYAWKYPEDGGAAVKAEPFTGGELTTEDKGLAIEVYQRITVKPAIIPADAIKVKKDDSTKTDDQADVAKTEGPDDKAQASTYLLDGKDDKVEVGSYLLNGKKIQRNRNGTYDIFLDGQTVNVTQSGFWFYQVRTEDAGPQDSPPAEPAKEPAAEPGTEPAAEPAKEPAEPATGTTDEPGTDKPEVTRSRVVETAETPPASEAAVPEARRPKLIPDKKLTDLPIMAQERSSEEYIPVTLRDTTFYKKGTNSEVAVAYYRAEDEYLTDLLGKFKFSGPPLGIQPAFFIWSGTIIGLMLMLAFAFFLYEGYFSKAAKKAAERRRAEESAKQAQKA